MNSKTVKGEVRAVSSNRVMKTEDVEGFRYSYEVMGVRTSDEPIAVFRGDRSTVVIIQSIDELVSKKD